MLGLSISLQRRASSVETVETESVAFDLNASLPSRSTFNEFLVRSLRPRERVSDMGGEEGDRSRERKRNQGVNTDRQLMGRNHGHGVILGPLMSQALRQAPM
jgi:hypothetical protein